MSRCLPGSPRSRILRYLSDDGVLPEASRGQYGVFSNHYLSVNLFLVIEDMNVFGFLTQRFYTQYIDLRNLYFESANVKYVASIIAVPTLPKVRPIAAPLIRF